MSLLVIMGSGETAPTMVKTHRRIFARAADGPAVLVDTPYGFQENADDITARARRYFTESVGRETHPLGWRRPGDALATEQALIAMREATWVFAGPGSPTYALRVWQPTGLAQELVDVCKRGGAVVFASAAALTLGSHTVPVYEIYKAGADPHWRSGLDVFAALTGVQAAIIPHFNNAEGGHHDTRYCYLGERRLRRLEADLPDEVGVLGVDEHTALLIDLERAQAEVSGNGLVTVRRRGRHVTFAAGTTVGLQRLVALLRGDADDEPDEPSPKDADAEADTGLGQPSSDSTSSGSTSLPSTSPAGSSAGQPASLRAETDQWRAAFTNALDDSDVAGCVRAVLGLEQAMHDWSADTLQSDEADYARRTLRGLVVRLGELVEAGASNPTALLGPYVDLLVDIRSAARQSGDFATGDRIRDRLRDLGVEVRDTRAGPQISWPARR